MDDLKKIQSLVGPIDYEQLRFIEYAICDQFGIFVPTLGPCYYSITPHHSHPSYMIIVNLHSTCKVCINGHTIDCEPEHLYIFSPDIIHHEIIEEEFNRYYACIIAPELFERSLRFYTNTIPVFTGKNFAIPESLMVYIHDFISEYENYDETSENQLSLLSERITHIIIRNIFQKNSRPRHVSYGTTVDKAIHYMHSCYNREISLDEIAHFTSSSPSHFLRLFKKATGYTPMEFLKKIRLEKARKLLGKSDASITDIAFSCGFNSSSYFATTFAAEYNKSPREFRSENLIISRNDYKNHKKTEIT